MKKDRLMRLKWVWTSETKTALRRMSIASEAVVRDTKTESISFDSRAKRPTRENR